jgi:hypothetical protein
MTKFLCAVIDKFSDVLWQNHIFSMCNTKFFLLKKLESSTTYNNARLRSSWAILGLKGLGFLPSLIWNFDMKFLSYFFSAKFAS